MLMLKHIKISFVPELYNGRTKYKIESIARLENVLIGQSYCNTKGVYFFIPSASAISHSELTEVSAFLNGVNGKFSSDFKYLTNIFTEDKYEF
jgi:hypothetical protein